MWSHRDPGLRKSGKGNIFVKGLLKTIDNQQLCDTFSKFGNILSCKVNTNARGEPLGYGFVHYESEESAAKAVEAVDGKMIGGQTVQVMPFKPKRERQAANKFTNLYVKNVPLDYEEAKFTALFAKYGTITSSKLSTDAEGKSRGFGFVNFSVAEEAAAALDELNNLELPEGKRLFVARAQKKEEREKQLRDRHEQMKAERQKKYAGVNLYIKNLSDEIDDERLRTEFSGFGSITSAVVMKDKASKSKGFGFVCFSAQEEAMKAMAEMNGRMLDGKPLYVALAQRAEERKARFEARFHQRNMAKGAPPPMYATVPHMGPPRPMVYGQMMHPGWPNQPMPMNRIGGPQMNYSLMPAAANRSGPPRRGRGQNQGPRGQRQGQNFKYAENVRNQRQPAPQAAQQQQQPVAATATSSEEDFVKDLAALPEEKRKQVIGGRLYPKVFDAQPELAPKITGMLLEMDNTEIIELLESPAALEKKIQEAMDVLKESSEQGGEVA
jgi:polyadenylate-binding protein